ncbi:conserved hypothetical protein [Neospora caninum Liverpool]|uniref:Uncharacterized protein n=1 Tax=Neospora caninum (strain Liverpool) TaxID=572307 RepID=F0V9Z9_NEOCL|nr:conserved hypothetical protein [Neospora caninum Liverpool]CBZ50488.1 conserved hypothetical protein [Neospora caninum Liverpool]|eukprot:XP_003880521.1 conserved hypothetical protein [Neospora caninum Liverpool]
MEVLMGHVDLSSIYCVKSDATCERSLIVGESAAGRGVESHGVLRDLVEEIIAPMLTKKYNVSGLAANWSFRYPSCDFRTAADSLYSNRGSMYVGLATPTPYMSKYFKASCPVMMYGMMSLISGYLRGPREGGVASWNKPDITIGTVAFLPYGKLVADHLPKARLRVYTTTAYLMAAVYSRDVHGFLLPSDAARGLLASGEFCADLEGGCKIIGNIVPIPMLTFTRVMLKF